MYEVFEFFGIALVGTVILGLFFIPILRRLDWGQHVREDGPAAHFSKAGTPTMGGLIFVVPVALEALLWMRNSPQVMAAVGTMLGFATIGFMDDFLKVILKRPLGLRARYKLTGQVIVAAALAVFLAMFLHRGTAVAIPFSGLYWDLGVWFYPLLLFVVVGTANAVNLTDGLDGLAAGTTFFAAAGYMFVAGALGQSSLGVFSAALAGGCAGFLVFNYHPARVFMGDTGSLALGAAIASVAALTETELVLVIIGGVYVLETLSVIIQVVSFRLTGRRVFLMSPVHHHFEIAGWSEKKIVLCFWLLAAIVSVLGVLSSLNLG